MQPRTHFLYHSVADRLQDKIRSKPVVSSKALGDSRRRLKKGDTFPLPSSMSAQRANNDQAVK